MNTAKEAQKNFYTASSVQYYTLFLLTLVNAFNLIDRQVLSILQEPIKRDLGLSDSQLGLLTGFAFVMFYVVAGIPIARWADRSVRRTIVSWSVGVWSAMTALSGLAQNYVQLLMARIGVGIGEAGCSPPAHSMISDIFPLHRRASALSIFQCGSNVGILFGFLFGGWLNHFLGWRMALLFIGLPGLMLALLVRFTVAEPIRGLSDKSHLHSQPATTLKQVSLLLWSRKSFRYLTIGGILTTFATSSVINWMASYMVRVHGMSTGELGNLLALSIGLSGGIGTFVVGLLADRLAVRDIRWYARLPAVALFVSALAYFAAFSMEDPHRIMLLTVIPMFLSNAHYAPCITMIHGMVAPNMRAMGSAAFLLFVNVFGYGLGSWLVGVASDSLQPAHGPESIRYALLYSAPAVALVGAVLFWCTGRRLREDMANAPT